MRAAKAGPAVAAGRQGLGGRLEQSSGPCWVGRNPDEVARGNHGAVTWTLVGDMGSPLRVAVDPAGYLWSPGCMWGVDWWIGADDRWHIPTREAAVRQSLIGDAPVVQTSVRVPSGDVHQRALVAPTRHGSQVFVEIFNDSAAPVAVALAVRPLTLLGPGEVQRAELRGQNVSVDGRPALTLPERPRRALLVTGSDPDPLAVVIDGAAPAAVDGAVACPMGLASAVVIVPLAHRSKWTYRLALAPSAAPGGGGRRRRARAAGPGDVTPGSPTPCSPTPAPTPESAGRGWRSQVERRLRLELPSDRITELLDAVRSHLLLAAGDPPPGPDGAEVLVAAATAGLDVASAGDVVAMALAAVHPGRRRPAVDAAAAALWASGRLTTLGSPPPEVGAVAELAEGVGRSGSGHPAGGAEAGWVVLGLQAASGLLGRAGEDRASTQAAGWAHAAYLRLGADRVEDGRLLVAALGEGVPAAPGGGPAGAPGGFDGRRSGGVDPALILLGAAADLRSGGPGWYDRVASVAAMASSTAAWPDLLDAQGLGGCGRVGHSALAGARLWSVMRDCLVLETGRIALLPGWPRAWLGQALEVHGLPTASGPVSFALRWHGDRPALLWSVDGPGGDLEVAAPALDPRWSSTELQGEVLLAAAVPA